MTPEEFEQKLSGVTLREPPPAWKREILSVAESKRAKKISVWPVLCSCLWPHPVAWAGVAAMWLVVLVLNLSGPRGDVLMTSGKPTPPRDPSAIETELAAIRLRSELLAAWSKEIELPPQHKL